MSQRFLTGIVDWPWANRLKMTKIFFFWMTEIKPPNPTNFACIRLQLIKTLQQNHLFNQHCS